LFVADPVIVALAVWPARLLALTVSLDAAARILGFALRGAGATRAATAVPFVTQCVILLPAMWWVGVQLGYGLDGVVSVQVTMTVLEAAAYFWIWSAGRWDGVRIGGLESSSAPERLEAAVVRRIAILGGAGSGKSTLARDMGYRLGVPVIHLDRLMYDPGWTRVATTVARGRLSNALPAEAWIVEGSYSEVSDLTLPKAELVVWIDQPTWLRAWRAWSKTRRHRDGPRSDRPDGCADAFDLHYLSEQNRTPGLTVALDGAVC
jgi:hypothetical protein